MTIPKFSFALCICCKLVFQQACGGLVMAQYLSWAVPTTAADQHVVAADARTSVGCDACNACDGSGGGCDLEVVEALQTPLHPASPLSVSPVYYGELFSNTRGGISTNNATQYLGLLDLAFEWNLGGGNSTWPGKLNVLAQNTHGRGLTQDFVGDTQVLSNIDAFGNITQISEYWWELTSPDEAITLRLGKQDINQEFLMINMAQEFVQSTFGLSPSSAFPTYPDPAMGAVILGQLNESWQLKAGVWNAFASGRGWGFSGDDTVLLIGEVERTHVFWEATLPGAIALAAVYESAGVIDGERVSPVHEYAIQFEQLIYRESVREEESLQGLGLFAGYYPRFPGTQRIVEAVGDSFVAGATYTGLVEGRDEDLLGTGVAWTELFQGGTNRELVYELFYRARVSPQLSLQPDLQYVGSPSGIHPDALVCGLRFQLDM